MSVPTEQNSIPLQHTSRHKNAKGFTLVELLTVVAIIGVLAAIAIPAYNNYVDKAQVTVAVSTLDAMRKNFEFFHIDNQEYPTEPINFTNGKDGATREVFSTMLLDQIDGDLTDVVYNTTSSGTALIGYKVTANVRNRAQTAMILTPNGISKAP